ncbi:MAG: mannanase [Verrucomicrobiota bacterium]
MGTRSSSSLPTVPAAGFVTVRNGRFELNGQPYRFIGANLWPACYLGDPKLNGGRTRLTRELDRLQKIDATNLRILAGSESCDTLAAAMRRGITRGPRDWDEDLLLGLDFTLAEMAKRNMRAVLFLSNYWQWSGGFAQYVRWINNEPIPDPDKPVMEQGDWSGFMRYSARFYTIPEAVALYRDYVTKLIRRRNTVNGRIYSEDPTIMTWELANEPRPATPMANSQGVEIFTQWIDATARFIHEQAPRQLVCAGSEGLHGCLEVPDVFLKVHQSPAIDYVTVHMWLKNWRWLKDPMLSPEYEAAAARGAAHVEEHTAMADKLHKPLVLEEFGLPRDHENLSPGSPVTARDDYFRRMFGQVQESCKAGRALQGANFWAWAGEGRAGGTYGSAPSYLGEPPCEPQGLNSIFDTDLSTQKVIAEANRSLKDLA